MSKTMILLTNNNKEIKIKESDVIDFSLDSNNSTNEGEYSGYLSFKSNEFNYEKNTIIENILINNANLRELFNLYFTDLQKLDKNTYKLTFTADYRND